MAIPDEDDHHITAAGDALRMTADIVASFVSNNKVSVDELAEIAQRDIGALTPGAGAIHAVPDAPRTSTTRGSSRAISSWSEAQGGVPRPEHVLAQAHGIFSFEFSSCKLNERIQVRHREPCDFRLGIEWS